MTVNDIRVQYGEVLSGEQVRQILHISKRKCTWILEHGHIPCSDTGGKTRRFAVRAEDLPMFWEYFNLLICCKLSKLRLDKDNA